MRLFVAALLMAAVILPAGCSDEGPEDVARTPSYVSIDSPRPGTRTLDSVIHAEGEMDDEVEVEWRNGAVSGRPQVYEHGFWWYGGEDIPDYISWRTWEADIPLEIGENTIVVTGTLPDGRRSEATMLVTRPAMIVTFEPSGEYVFQTSLSTWTFQGAVLRASDVPVLSVVCRNEGSGVQVVAYGTHSWTAEVPLVEGTNMITVTAVDELGRTASGSRWVVKSAVP